MFALPHYYKKGLTLIFILLIFSGLILKNYNFNSTFNTSDMFETIKNMFSKNYTDLNGSDFKEKYKTTKNAVLIDVRSAGEFNSGKIEGAKNIDIMSAGFMSKIEALGKDKVYFVYCRSGARSGSACSTMGSNGFEAYNLQGGIGSWR
jgi:rhodanese-related sulfurtransferase